MKPKKHFSLAEKGGLLICSILFFSLTSMVIKKIHSKAREDEKDFKISKLISVASLKTIFEKTQKKEMPIYVYIVKKSAKEYAKDFKILLYYTDAAGKLISIGHGNNEEELKVNSAFYISYLHNKRISKQDVTLGYELHLTEPIIRNAASLKITIFPLQPQRNILNFTPSTSCQSSQLRYDSCKIPPGCQMHVPIASHINASIEKIYSAKVVAH
jgi:hypothetical protein